MNKSRIENNKILKNFVNDKTSKEDFMTQYTVTSTSIELSPLIQNIYKFDKTNSLDVDFLKSIVNHLLHVMENPKSLYNGFYNENIKFNNFQSFRIYIIAIIYDFLDIENNWKEIENLYIKQCEINLNYIQSDKNSEFNQQYIGFDYHHRDSILYHEYNLSALFYTCKILESHDSSVDFYKYIKNAVLFLLPFYNHTIKHILYKNSLVVSDVHNPLYLKQYNIKMSNKWFIKDLVEKDVDFKNGLNPTVN
jgi:hypothetical protein